MMKIKTRNVLGISVIIVGLFASLLCCSGEKKTLLANGPVPVYKTQEDALSGNRSLASGMLSKGQKVLILKYIDVKHYQIYTVELSDGVTGFINDGDYSVLKNME
jgi:hypothetical protein